MLGDRGLVLDPPLPASCTSLGFLGSTSWVVSCCGMVGRWESMAEKWGHSGCHLGSGFDWNGSSVAQLLAALSPCPAPREEESYLSSLQVNEGPTRVTEMPEQV